MSPRAQGQQRKEGSAAPLRLAGVASLFPGCIPQNTGQQMLSKCLCGSPTYPLHGRPAGNVPELLNRAISALNFEPGSAETGHGGWDGVALITMKRMSAIHPTPQVGEHRLGSSQENRKPLYTHILPDFYSWREEDTQAQQHSGPWARCLEKSKATCCELNWTQQQCVSLF